MRIDIQIARMPDIRRMSQRALARLNEGLNQAALKAVELIKVRTAAGVGVDGAFVAYSESYEKHRLERGFSATPNLFYSGKMLNAMQIKQGEGYAEIYFSGKQENKKAAFNNELRPFFDLNKDERKQVTSVLRRYIG